jgi:hypothetical protein
MGETETVSMPPGEAEDCPMRATSNVGSLISST